MESERKGALQPSDRSTEYESPMEKNKRGQIDATKTIKNSNENLISGMINEHINRVRALRGEVRQVLGREVPDLVDLEAENRGIIVATCLAGLWDSIDWLKSEFSVTEDPRLRNIANKIRWNFAKEMTDDILKELRRLEVNLPSQALKYLENWADAKLPRPSK